MHANATAHAMATVAGTYPCASKDDIRWCFFQIYLEPCEQWMSIQYLVFEVCTQCRSIHLTCKCTDRHGGTYLALFAVKPRVVTMGARPSSKIAVEISKGLNDEWRQRMDDYVIGQWLPEQNETFKTLLDMRERSLGFTQARPFFCTESPTISMTSPSGHRCARTAHTRDGAWPKSSTCG